MAVTFLARMAAMCACVVLGACSGGEINPAASPMGLGCVDDSPHCVTERGNALKGLMADKSKAWVRSPSSPAAYASGVRLWAFKQKKRELSCDELSIARREADGAAPTLRAASKERSHASAPASLASRRVTPAAA